MNSALLLEYITVVYIFIIGLCIGSFLNVVILRGLSGEKLVFDRSRCPKCKNQLKWYMNIPLLSFLFLKGKCAYCSSAISIQYPIVEFLTGAGFLASYYAFGLGIKMLFVWTILSLFIVLSVSDIKEKVILDIHAYILLAVGLLYSLSGIGDVNIIQALIAAIGGFLIFEILAFLGKITTGCRMFGEGDSLIACALGAIFGLKMLCLLIVLSFIIQTFSSVPVLINRAFLNNNKKLAVSYIFVIFSLLFLLIVNCFDLIKNYSLYFGIALILSVILLYSLKNIIHEIKNKKLEDKNEDEKFCLLPFGPALLVSGTIILFYADKIKEIIYCYIY